MSYKDITDKILDTIFNRSTKGNCFDESPSYFGRASYKQFNILKTSKRLASVDCFGHVYQLLEKYYGWRVKFTDNPRFGFMEVKFYKEVIEP